MSIDDPLLLAHEAAELLNVRPATVYQWANKGLLPHVRIRTGGTRPVLRFRKSDLERFLRERTVEPRDRRS